MLDTLLSSHPATLTTITVLGGVFIASILGSGHCAGMCGPIMLFALGSLDKPTRSKWRVHLAYHLGRGISYTLLGVIAGAAGAAMDLGGSFVGIQRIGGIIFGIMMIAMGAGLISSKLSSRVHLPKLPDRFQRVVEHLYRFAWSLPPVARALAVGQLTPLLPCGWLYMYVLAAAGSANMILGGMVLAAFWAGTLPILASLGAGIELLSAPLRSRLPMVSGLVVVTLGLMTVFGRFSLPTFSTEDQRSLLTSHQGGSTLGSSFVIPTQTPPCCLNEGELP